MIWVELVSMLAVLQFTVYGFFVGAARVKHNVKAPAMSGHDVFERNVRVHMNTLETLMLLLPSMWIAAQHWSPRLCAALGAVYLVGRLVYRLSYLKDPGKRSLGYGLSFMPAAILAIAAIAGVVRQLLRAGGTV
jgi:uncharacterized MAPEG superfamily protein